MGFIRKKIGSWVDGDSGRFTDGIPYRLARVRAQESYQYGSSTATRRAAGMTGRYNGNVGVRVVGQSYGRKVVEMINRDGSINNRMIRRGARNKGR